jgi:hypothetical protein
MDAGNAVLGREGFGPRCGRGRRWRQRSAVDDALHGAISAEGAILAAPIKPILSIVSLVLAVLLRVEET